MSKTVLGSLSTEKNIQSRAQHYEDMLRLQLERLRADNEQEKEDGFFGERNIAAFNSLLSLRGFIESNREKFVNRQIDARGGFDTKAYKKDDREYVEDRRLKIDDGSGNMIDNPNFGKTMANPNLGKWLTKDGDLADWIMRSRIEDLDFIDKISENIFGWHSGIIDLQDGEYVGENERVIPDPGQTNQNAIYSGQNPVEAAIENLRNLSSGLFNKDKIDDNEVEYPTYTPPAYTPPSGGPKLEFNEETQTWQDPYEDLNLNLSLPSSPIIGGGKEQPLPEIRTSTDDEGKVVLSIDPMMEDDDVQSDSSIGFKSPNFIDAPDPLDLKLGLRTEDIASKDEYANEETEEDEETQETEGTGETEETTEIPAAINNEGKFENVLHQQDIDEMTFDDAFNYAFDNVGGDEFTWRSKRYLLEKADGTKSTADSKTLITDEPRKEFVINGVVYDSDGNVIRKETFQDLESDIEVKSKETKDFDSNVDFNNLNIQPVVVEPEIEPTGNLIEEYYDKLEDGEIDIWTSGGFNRKGNPMDLNEYMYYNHPDNYKDYRENYYKAETDDSSTKEYHWEKYKSDKNFSIVENEDGTRDVKMREGINPQTKNPYFRDTSVTPENYIKHHEKLFNKRWNQVQDNFDMNEKLRYRWGALGPNNETIGIIGD